MAPPSKITLEKNTVQVLADFLATGLRGISPSSGRKFPRLAGEGF
jgi:hypothetical protein